MNPRNRNILIAVVIIVIVAVAAFFGFNHKSNTSNASSKTVNIGIMTPTPADKAIWDNVSSTAKSKYGITLKFTYFTDYTQPNKALASGSIDLNAFQTDAFLVASNQASKENLVPIGATIITPIHLYSTKYKSVSDLPAGSSIAVPNDAANESRAIYLLEGAGLIKLNVTGDTLASPKNIVSNPKNIVIQPLDASQTAHALGSVAASVINTNYAQAAKITFKNSIFAEPLNANSKQYINYIVANKKDENNNIYKEVVKAYETTQTENVLKKQYPDGSTIAAWNLKL